MKASRRRRRRGFTLIELLMVIAIIMILATMIMTAVYSSQEAGRAAVCRGNLKQLNQMILQYTSSYGGFLPCFWHERWVGELGLVGKGWGNLKDDRNPNVPTVWHNGSPTQYFLCNYNRLTNKPQALGYTGGHAYQGEERVLLRTGAPVVHCPSDLSNYRCDQGCLTSYMGLAKYGWWHRGNSILWAVNSYCDHRQIQEVAEPTTSIMLLESEPGTWQVGGCG